MPKSLLLADGNPTTQRIVAMTFAAEDMTIVSVDDGEQAISRIAAEKPDIVLADVAAPKRSGYDVAAFVKGRPDLAHIPVLLLAGALEPVDQARARAVRCDGVLVKPFEPQQVVARVRELVNGGTGHAGQVTPGVPRPIDRLIESRQAPAPAAAPAREAGFGPPVPPKVVKHPSASAAPPSGPAPVTRETADDDPLGDYFDQLDAAFDDLGPARPPAAGLAEAHEDETERLEVPTLDSVLGDFSPSTPLGTGPSTPPEPKPAFKDEILFAGAPVEPPDIRPVPSPDPPREIPLLIPRPEPDAKPALDLHQPATAFHALIEMDRKAREQDALIEAVATRVIEKLAPSGISDLVSKVVADVTERLVREEIDRIRGRK